MRHATVTVALIVACALLMAGCAGTQGGATHGGYGQAVAATTSFERDEFNAPLRAALAKRIDVKFEKSKLSDAIEHFRTHGGLNVYVHWLAMENAGVERDRSVSLKLRSVKTSTALDLLTRRLSEEATEPIAWAIRDRVLQIAPESVLRKQVELRVYNVRDLLLINRWRVPQKAAPGEDGDKVDEVDHCIDRVEDQMHFVIHDLIGDPEDWRELDGMSQTLIYDGLLTVITTPENHREVAQLLAMLRQAAGSDVKAVSLKQRNQAGRRDATRNELTKKLTIRYSDRKLPNVLDDLRTRAMLDIHVDWHALENVGVDKETLVNIPHKPDDGPSEYTTIKPLPEKITAAHALDLVMKQISIGAADPITYFMKDGVVVVTTTPETEWSMRDIRTYNLRDLLEGRGRMEGPAPNPTGRDSPREGFVDADDALFELAHTVCGPPVRRGSLQQPVVTWYMYDGLLIVDGHPDTHARLARFLAMLRQAAAKPGAISEAMPGPTVE